MTAIVRAIDALNVHCVFAQEGYSIAIPKKLVMTSAGTAAVPSRVRVRVASVVRLEMLER